MKTKTEYEQLWHFLQELTVQAFYQTQSGHAALTSLLQGSTPPELYDHANSTLLAAFLLDEDPEVKRLTEHAIRLSLLLSQFETRKIVERLPGYEIHCSSAQQTKLTLSMSHFQNVDIADLEAIFSLIERSELQALNLASDRLGYLNLIKIKTIFSAIEHSELTTLDISNNQLEALDFQCIKAISKSILHSKLTSLDLRYYKFHCNNVQRIKKLKSLSTAIQNSHITYLNLNHCQLGALDLNCINVLSRSIQKSKLITLELACNNLSDLNLVCLKALLTAIEKSSITTLNLIYNNLGALDIERLQVIGQLLEKSQITTLNLSDNNLHNLDYNPLRVLTTAIGNSKLKILNLEKNQLNQFDAPHLALLTTAIEKSPLKALNIRHNNLYHLDFNRFRMLTVAIKHSHLKTLDISNNHLSDLDTNCFREFTRLIANSPLTSIYSLDNLLYKLDFGRFQILATAIEQSHLRTLNLQLNNLSVLKDESKRVLTTAIQRNSTLIPEDKFNDLSEEMMEALQRNKKLLTICQDLESTSKGCGSLEVNIDQWQQLADIAIDEMTLWRSFDFPQATLACARLQESITNYALALFKTERIVYDRFLPCLAVNNKMSNAIHAEYFLDCYNKNRSVVSGVNKAANVRYALLKALPYCFDINFQFISFHDPYRVFFDATLLEASGGHSALRDHKLSANERLALLQWLLLHTLQEELSNSIHDEGNSNRFFNQNGTSKFIAVLKKSLPKIENQSDLDDRKISLLSALWSYAQLHLQNTPLEDIQLAHLVTACEIYSEKLRYKSYFVQNPAKSRRPVLN